MSRNNQNRNQTQKREQQNKTEFVSFPVNTDTDETVQLNEIQTLKETIEESSKTTASYIANAVFNEIVNSNNPYAIPFKLIGKIGAAIRGKKRTPTELVEESLDRNLDSDRNQAAGGAPIISLFFGWLVSNQAIIYITKPLRWMGADKVLGIFATPLHWINTIFTTNGVPLAKTLLSFNVSKGIVTVSIAQGLVNALVVTFNVVATCLIVYPSIMLITSILERYRLRQVILKLLGKK